MNKKIYIIIGLLLLTNFIYANHGAGGAGTSDKITNLIASCPVVNFIVPSLYPTVLSISHNITNTNMILVKDDIIRVSILMNTNMASPYFRIGGIVSDLPTRLSNNFTYTGSYTIQENDYELKASVIGYISYAGSNSQKNADSFVNIDARPVIIPPGLGQIIFLNHRSDPDTQFTPDTRIEVIMTLSSKVSNEQGYFSILGLTNVTFLSMQKISSNVMQGSYLIQKNDFIENGTLRGYVVGLDNGILKTNTLDKSSYINICPVVKEQNNDLRRIVIQSIDVADQNRDEQDTVLVLPQGSLKEDVKIRIEPVSLLNYKYTVKDLKNKELEKLPKHSQVRIRYHVINGVVEGLNIPADKVRGNIALFYSDKANKWKKISEDIDIEKFIVYGKASHTGIYAIKLNEIIDKVVIAPNPFTPGNQDGVNDSVIFYVKNINQEEVKSSIFTLEGYKVCEIPAEKIIINGTISLIEWDGKKDNRVVDGGLYVIKIKVGGTWYTATVVLAK